MFKKFKLSIPKIILLVFLFLIGFTVIFLFSLRVIIARGTTQRCHLAQAKYPGSCVEALISYIEDQNNSLKDRNQAVWALGHWQDKQALPVLKKYYNGEECDHKKSLCQYELKKAIDKIEKGTLFSFLRLL